ncbi:MAG: signal peptide peptidase SppA [Rubrobacteraceae bacterium]
MSFVVRVLVNFWYVLRNSYVRFARRVPDFVVFEVGGSLPELTPPTSFLRRRIGRVRQTLSLEEVRRRLSRISRNGRVRGVVLRVQDLDAGWASLEELRDEIMEFRNRGGYVVAYLAEADTRSYYLACAADEVLATPLATISVTGFRTRITFVKDSLQRVGVEAEVFAVSPYKSAYDTYVRQEFSHEAREQAERLADRRFAQLIEAVADGRGVSPEAARERIDLAPYSAAGAAREGLLDGVCYEDELPEKLGAADGKATLAEWNVARRALKMPYRRRARRRVGLVSLSGIIVRGKSRKLPIPLPLVGGDQAGSESVVAALRVAERNSRVAAVLFHVDSRGGDSLASDLIWREVRRINEKKPVVVLMGNAAASGGYYVSAPASHIVARQSTLTGSIGVISLRPVATDLYEKLRVNPVSVERGARAGLFDASRQISDDERQVLADRVQEVYSEFKDRVVEGRDLGLERLEELAGGRVWTGAEARDLGLVDELGGWRTALNRARDLGGIQPDAPDVVVRVSPPKTGRPTPAEPADATREMVEDYIDALSELRASKVWALSPYTFFEDW